MSIVIGFDPGIAIVGYGVLKVHSRDSQDVLAVGAIETHASVPHPQRLKEVYDEIKILLDTFSPDVAGVENLYFGRNTTTAMKVAEGRGVLMLALEQSNVPIEEFTPLQVKMALTGYGRADKRQMQLMVKSLLGLDAIPRPDDAADALAVALTVAVSGAIT